MRRLWIATVVFAVVVVGAMVVLQVNIDRGLRRADEATDAGEARALADAREDAEAYADDLRAAAVAGPPDDARLVTLAEPHGATVLGATRESELIVTVMTTGHYASALFGGSLLAYACADLRLTGAGSADAAVDTEHLESCPPVVTWLTPPPATSP